MTAEANGNGKAKDRRARVEPAFLLVLTVDGEETAYVMTALPSDYGWAFRLAKLGGDGAVYELVIDDAPWGRADACCCKGFCRWGKCKHASAVRALIEAGKLAVQPVR